jgi:hypothetical protein
LEHDNGALCSPHLRAAEEIRELGRKGGGCFIIPPSLHYITVSLYCKIIVNEPIFVLYSYLCDMIIILCAMFCCRNVLIHVFFRHIVCRSFVGITRICAILVTVNTRELGGSKIEVFNIKYCICKVRYIRLHVESADITCVGGQVDPGTVRRVVNRLVHGAGTRREGRRDGTARVVLMGRAMAGPGSNKLVCCCRRCSEDLARELNKFTCIHSAGKCWNRIGTSTLVFFIIFYDG